MKQKFLQNKSKKKYYKFQPNHRVARTGVVYRRAVEEIREEVGEVVCGHDGTVVLADLIGMAGEHHEAEDGLELREKRRARNAIFSGDDSIFINFFYFI